MKSSTTIQNLAAALAAAQAEMPIVPFDSKNPFLKNSYASLGSVINATRPVLAKFKLAVVQFAVSADGKIERQGLELDSRGEPIAGAVSVTKREGVSAIGIETMLLHASGEWVSETMLLPMAKEKGKSDAQMAGSMITYMRRYAWTSILGLYADEDTDGQDEPGNGGGGGQRGREPETTRFEDLPTKPPATTSRPAATTTAPASPPAAVEQPDPIATLKKKAGPILSEFVRYLQYHPVNAQGQVILPPPNPIERLSLPWAVRILEKWDETLAAVEVWCTQNPPTGAEAEATVPIEVPRDANIDPHSPSAAWRQFKMPWGKEAGQPLEKLDKKYLFGLWANHKVETEYRGKPRTPQQVADDTLFRAMLDEAGKHYEFTK